jgi:hypothetical protein
MKEYKIKPLLKDYWNMNWGHVMFPFADGYFADIRLLHVRLRDAILV